MVPQLRTYKVFVNGCFDLLHVGHIRFLQWAKIYGISQSSLLRCRLIVAINSDESVMNLKGVTRPIIPQGERREMLEALDCVDEVIIFYEDTPHKVITEVKPDCIVIGPDHTGRGYGDIPVVAYPGKKVHSTSKLLGKL